MGYDNPSMALGIASEAEMSEAIKRHEINMMRNVIAEQKSAGKNLMGLAASVLYLSCLKYEQNEISQVIIKFISLTYIMIYRRLLADFLGIRKLF